MSVKDFLNRIISAFNEYVIPFLEIVSKKIDLYYVSLGIFAFAAIAGGISLLLRLTFKKVRDSSCFKLLTLFALCFVSDVFVCVCEHEFNAKYFKTLFSAFSFCIIKLFTGAVFFAIIGLETLILRRNDRKNNPYKTKTQTVNDVFGQNAQKTQSAQNDVCAAHKNPYLGKDYAAALSSPKNKNDQKAPFVKARVIETPSCPLKDIYLGEKSAAESDLFGKIFNERNEKSNSIEYLQRANSNRDAEKDNVRPDVNVAYVFALCECLKKEVLSESDRERIADIELSLKFGGIPSPTNVRNLNDDFCWLIKKIADCGARIAP